VKRRNLNHVLVALELEGYVKRPASNVDCKFHSTSEM
jgi:hypothetical protein